MKAVRFHVRGDHNDLVYEDAPRPNTATGDVLLKVHAASFVPDEFTWPGTWVDRAGRDRIPSIPAHEVAGVVEELGSGTSDLAVGDRVFGLTDWHRDGAAAEYVAVEARNLTAMPRSLDFVQAAALPLAGLTAWQGLFVHGGMRSGQTVVVHGAVGGVGVFAVQLARQAGAHVIATGRDNAADLAGELGAQTFVDLQQAPLEEAVGQVDLVFDTVGGDLLARSARLVKPGGTLVSITAPPPEAPERGRSVFFIVEPDRTQLAGLAQRVDDGLLRPHVGAVFPLTDTKKAFIAKQQGIPGKVVLKI
jgi:NADPH:quinone reductase-like Zn-dependent oxidoreductase